MQKLIGLSLHSVSIGQCEEICFLEGLCDVMHSQGNGTSGEHQLGGCGLGLLSLLHEHLNFGRSQLLHSVCMEDLWAQKLISILLHKKIAS